MNFIAIDDGWGGRLYINPRHISRIETAKKVGAFLDGRTREDHGSYVFLNGEQSGHYLHDKTPEQVLELIGSVAI